MVWFMAKLTLRYMTTRIPDLHTILAILSSLVVPKIQKLKSMISIMKLGLSFQTFLSLHLFIHMARAFKQYVFEGA